VTYAGYKLVRSYAEALAPHIDRSLQNEIAAQAIAAAKANAARARHSVTHTLRVAEVDRITDDAVAITFEVADELREHYRFTQGQHLTVRTDLGGQDVRRNYSICTPVSSERLRIGVRHIPGGVFSAYALNELEPGAELEVMTPSGRFFTELRPGQAKHYAAVAVGSGITPILSILATTLEVEPGSRFTLLYGNRTKDSTMFRDELDELEKRYPDRLRVWHFLSREQPDDPLFSGRIDTGKLTALLADRLPAAEVDEWFLCGPQELVHAARDILVENGVATDHVHSELFHVEPDAEAKVIPWQPSTVTVVVDGEPATFDWMRGSANILDVALDQGVPAPYACRDGVCGTCRARLLEGTAEMVHNYSLDDHEVEGGYVLTCQAHPTSAEVFLDYDG